MSEQAKRIEKQRSARERAAQRRYQELSQDGAIIDLGPRVLEPPSRRRLIAAEYGIEGERDAQALKQ